MGRSHGGLTTKIHAVVDANGLPITLKLTPGQAHDGRSADDMLGTPKAGQTLIADAGYGSNRLRDDNFLASVQLASLRIWMRFNESAA